MRGSPFSALFIDLLPAQEAPRRPSGARNRNCSKVRKSLDLRVDPQRARFGPFGSSRCQPGGRPASASAASSAWNGGFLVTRPAGRPQRARARLDVGDGGAVPAAAPPRRLLLATDFFSFCWGRRLCRETKRNIEAMLDGSHDKNTPIWIWLERKVLSVQSAGWPCMIRKHPTC